MLCDPEWKMECDEELIFMQAERELHYMKQQLIKQVQMRRDKKINELRIFFIVSFIHH